VKPLVSFVLRLPVGVRDVLLDRIGQLVAPWHALDDYVLILDSGFLQLPLCALEQRIDDLGVPACVDNADAKCGACMTSSESHSCGGGGVARSLLACLPSYVLGAPGPLIVAMLSVRVWMDAGR
jgi:hypothetical protein